MVEFADVLDLPTVTGVVEACWRDLRGAPGAALPELAERLARQDLADLAARAVDRTVAAGAVDQDNLPSVR